MGEGLVSWKGMLIVYLVHLGL